MPEQDTQAHIARWTDLEEQVARSARPRAQQAPPKESEPSRNPPLSKHPASSPHREVTPAEDQPSDDDSWRPTADDDQQSQPDVYQASPESSADVLRRLRDQRAELNKENLQETSAEGARKKPRFFNERQDSARRINFDDDDDEDDEPPSRAQRTAPNEVGSGEDGNGDARREEDDDDEDDAFETDARPADVVRRIEKPAVGRSANVPRQQLLRTVKAPATTQNDDGTGVKWGRGETQQRAANATRNESSRAETERSTSVQEDDDQIPYRRINQLAKTTVALRGQRKVQVRRPWSEQATARLIELIEDDRYGTSWVTIENLNDPLLEGRGQGALKDKARNVKMDFLKAGIDLPINFENVRLNRLQIQTLQGLGISYEQERIRG